MNTVHLQDCIEGIKCLETKSADIIIADPPYNIGKDFGNDSDKQKMDDYLKWCDEWIAECFRVLKDDGHIFFKTLFNSTNISYIHSRYCSLGFLSLYLLYFSPILYGGLVTTTSILLSKISFNDSKQSPWINLYF